MQNYALRRLLETHNVINVNLRLFIGDVQIETQNISKLGNRRDKFLRVLKISHKILSVDKEREKLFFDQKCCKAVG